MNDEDEEDKRIEEQVGGDPEFIRALRSGNNDEEMDEFQELTDDQLYDKFDLEYHSFQQYIRELEAVDRLAQTIQGRSIVPIPYLDDMKLWPRTKISNPDIARSAYEYLDKKARESQQNFHKISQQESLTEYTADIVQALDILSARSIVRSGPPLTAFNRYPTPIPLENVSMADATQAGVIQENLLQLQSYFGNQEKNYFDYSIPITDRLQMTPVEQQKTKDKSSLVPFFTTNMINVLNQMDPALREDRMVDTMLGRLKNLFKNEKAAKRFFSKAVMDPALQGTVGFTSDLIDFLKQYTIEFALQDQNAVSIGVNYIREQQTGLGKRKQMFVSPQFNIASQDEGNSNIERIITVNALEKLIKPFKEVTRQPYYKYISGNDASYILGDQRPLGAAGYIKDSGQLQQYLKLPIIHFQQLNQYRNQINEKVGSTIIAQSFLAQDAARVEARSKRRSQLAADFVDIPDDTVSVQSRRMVSVKSGASRTVRFADADSIREIEDEEAVDLDQLNAEIQSDVDPAEFREEVKELPKKARDPFRKPLAPDRPAARGMRSQTPGRMPDEGRSSITQSTSFARANPQLNPIRRGAFETNEGQVSAQVDLFDENIVVGIGDNQTLPVRNKNFGLETLAARQMIKDPSGENFRKQMRMLGTEISVEETEERKRGRNMLEEKKRLQDEDLGGGMRNKMRVDQAMMYGDDTATRFSGATILGQVMGDPDFKFKNQVQQMQAISEKNLQLREELQETIVAKAKLIAIGEQQRQARDDARTSDMLANYQQMMDQDEGRINDAAGGIQPYAFKIGDVNELMIHTRDSKNRMLQEQSRKSAVTIMMKEYNTNQARMNSAMSQKNDLLNVILVGLAQDKEYSKDNPLVEELQSAEGEEQIVVLKAILQDKAVKFDELQREKKELNKIKQQINQVDNNSLYSTRLITLELLQARRELQKTMGANLERRYPQQEFENHNREEKRIALTRMVEFRAKEIDAKIDSISRMRDQIVQIRMREQDVNIIVGDLKKVYEEQNETFKKNTKGLTLDFKLPNNLEELLKDNKGVQLLQDLMTDADNKFQRAKDNYESFDKMLKKHVATNQQTGQFLSEVTAQIEMMKSINPTIRQSIEDDVKMDDVSYTQMTEPLSKIKYLQERVNELKGSIDQEIDLQQAKLDEVVKQNNSYQTAAIAQKVADLKSKWVTNYSELRDIHYEFTQLGWLDQEGQDLFNNISQYSQGVPSQLTDARAHFEKYAKYISQKSMAAQSQVQKINTTTVELEKAALRYHASVVEMGQSTRDRAYETIHAVKSMFGEIDEYKDAIKIIEVAFTDTQDAIRADNLQAIQRGLDVIKNQSEYLGSVYQTNQKGIMKSLLSIQEAASKFDHVDMMTKAQGMASSFETFIKSIEHYKLDKVVDLSEIRTLTDPATVRSALLEKPTDVQEAVFMISDKVTRQLQDVQNKFDQIENFTKRLSEDKLQKYIDQVRHQNFVLSTRLSTVYNDLKNLKMEVPASLENLKQINPNFNVTIDDIEATMAMCKEIDQVVITREEQLGRIKDQIMDLPVEKFQKLPREFAENKYKAVFQLDNMREIVKRLGMPDLLSMVENLGNLIETSYTDPSLSSTIMFVVKKVQDAAHEKLTLLEMISAQAVTIDTASYKRLDEEFRTLGQTMQRHLGIIDQIYTKNNQQLPQVYDRLRTAQPVHGDYINVITNAASQVLEDINTGQKNLVALQNAASTVDTGKLKAVIDQFKNSADDVKYRARKMAEAVQARGFNIPMWLQNIINTDPFQHQQAFNIHIQTFKDQYDELIRASGDQVKEFEHATTQITELQKIVDDTQEKLRIRKSDLEVQRLDIQTTISDIRGVYRKQIPAIDYTTSAGIQRGVQAVDRIRNQVTTESQQIEQSMNALNKSSSELQSRLQSREATMLVVDRIKRQVIGDLVQIKAITPQQALQEPTTAEVIQYVTGTRDREQELQAENQELVNRVEGLNTRLVTLKRQVEQNEILKSEAANKIQDMAMQQAMLKVQTQVLKHQSSLYDEIKTKIDRRGHVVAGQWYTPEEALQGYYAQANTYSELITKYNNKIRVAANVYDPEQRRVLDFTFGRLPSELRFLAEQVYVVENMRYPSNKLEEIGKNVATGARNAVKAHFTKLNELLMLSPRARIGQEGSAKIGDYVAKGIVELNKTTDLLDVYKDQLQKFQTINNRFWGIHSSAAPNDNTLFENTYLALNTQLGYEVDDLKRMTLEQLTKIDRINARKDRVTYDDIEEFQIMVNRDVAPRLQKISDILEHGNGDSVLRPYIRNIEDSSREIATRVQNAVHRGVTGSDDIMRHMQSESIGIKFASAYNKLYFSLGSQFVRFVGNIHGVGDEGKGQLIQALSEWQRMDPRHNRDQGVLAEFDRRSVLMADEVIQNIGTQFKHELIDLIVDRCSPKIGSILMRMDGDQFSEVLKQALKGDESIFNRNLFQGQVLGEKGERFQRLKQEFVEKTLDEVDQYGRYRRDYRRIFHGHRADQKADSVNELYPVDPALIKERIVSAQSKRILLPGDKLLGTNLKDRKPKNSIYDVPIIAASFLQTQKYIKEANPEQLNIAKQNMAEFRQRAREFQQNVGGIDDYRNLQAYVDAHQHVLRSITQDGVLQNATYTQYNLGVPMQQKHFQRDLLAQIGNAALVYDGKSRMAMDMGLPYDQDKLFLSLAFHELVRDTYNDVQNYLRSERNRNGHQDFAHDLKDYEGNINIKREWIRNMELLTDNFDAEGVQGLMDRKVEEYKQYNKEFSSAQQEQINQIDNLIVQMEERNNQYGSVNQLKQQLGADFERGVMDTIRRTGLGNYQDPQVREQMLRHLSRASGNFRDTPIPQSQYDARRVNPGLASRHPQHTREILEDQRQPDSKKEPGSVLSEGQLKHLQSLNLITPAQLQKLMQTVIRNGIPYKKENGQLVKLNDKEKLEVAMILIDLCLVILVTRLKTMSKEKASEMRDKLRVQAKEENGVQGIANRVKELVNQL